MVVIVDMVAPSGSDRQTPLALAQVYYQSVGVSCLFACQHYRVQTSTKSARQARWLPLFVVRIRDQWTKKGNQFLMLAITTYHTFKIIHERSQHKKPSKSRSTYFGMRLYLNLREKPERQLSQCYRPTSLLQQTCTTSRKPMPNCFTEFNKHSASIINDLGSVNKLVRCDKADV